MARKVGDIMAPIGKYLKDGEEKTSWLKCGALLETDKGFRIKMDALPVVIGEGWFQVFEPRDDKQSQSRPSTNSRPAAPHQNQEDDPQDDIPF
jgi:hypothetical protein